MQYPLPPQIEAAQKQLLSAIEAVEKRPVDPLGTPWAELERSVVKLLGGAFDIDKYEHQAIALGISALFGARLVRDHQAFWFPNREALEGAVMGFPEALIMISPFGAVVEALRNAKLERLDEMAKELSTSLARVKFSAAGQAGQQRLNPLDYQRMFDPGFVQFVVIDPNKAKAAWDNTPDGLVREIRMALGRSGSSMPEEAKKQFEAQIVSALQRLDPKVSLMQQVERAPRVAELIGHLFGTVSGTGAAPEELWHDVVMPLLHIGAPEQFPPLDEPELEAARQGTPALLIYLDAVPYATPAPEEGLLGAFAVEELMVPHPGFEKVGSLRLVKLNRERLKPLLQAFDPKKTRASVARFGALLEQKTGQKPAPGGEAEKLLEAAMSLLEDLKKADAAAGDLCLRRVTEAEAASDAALSAVRSSLQGPKIILA